MPNAAEVGTLHASFSQTQGASASQGSMYLELPAPIFTGQVSSNFIYKMRGWDTVDEQYIFWTSFGDTNTPPPTLHPVTGITATKGVRTRTG